MNATMPKSVRTTLFDMKQLPVPDLLGKEGLQNLIAAIRRMIAWLLSPFRTVAKVLFGQGAPSAAEPSAVLATGNAPEQPAPGADNVAFAPSIDEPGLMQEGLDDGGMADLMLASGAGSVDVELHGPAEEIDMLLPMLQKHVEQLLKSHLPADADAAKIEARVVALAETAEYVRYAHHIVSGQVVGMVKGISEKPLYAGMSQNTILELVRASGSGGTKGNADGSDEERVLGRLALQERLASDYQLQLRQIAALLVRPAEQEDVEAGESGQVAPNPLEAAVLLAGDLARSKLFQPGTVMRSNLAALPDALSAALAMAKASAHQKVEVEEVVVEPVEVAAVAESNSVPATAAVPEVVVPVASPARPVVKPSGMFGTARVERSADELEEANLIDDDMPEMEGMVVG